MATTGTRYDRQRSKKNPPHITLRALREALGLTLAEVCKRMDEDPENTRKKPFTVGGLSAIEGGHRGPSVETIAALERALGLRPGSIALDYEPSHSRLKVIDGEAS